MSRQLKILLAKAILTKHEDKDRHDAMKTCLENGGDRVTERGASGTYPVVRTPSMEDLDKPTELVEDPARHSYTTELRARKKLEQEYDMDCLVVDMSFNSSQLGYMVGQASARGVPVLVLREKSSAVLQPRFDQFETDENVTVHEYTSQQELARGIHAFKGKVREKVAGKKDGSQSA